MKVIHKVVVDQTSMFGGPVPGSRFELYLTDDGLVRWIETKEYPDDLPG